MKRHATTPARRPRVTERRHDNGRPTALIAALALAWGAGLATQYVAARLGYASQLGGWLYRAPATSRLWLQLAVAACAVAVLIALLIHQWRWASVPLTLVTASVYAVLDGPIYPPTDVLRWYATQGPEPVDRTPFRLAWIIVVVSVILTTTAAHRLGQRHVSRPGDRRPMARGKDATIIQAESMGRRSRRPMGTPPSPPATSPAADGAETSDAAIVIDSPSERP
jgi:hypothetical protein